MYWEMHLSNTVVYCIVLKRCIPPIWLRLFRWGVYDVDDAVRGALHLSQTGEVDEESLAISGGSAGGYTVLAALTFKDVFKVGK